MIFFKRKKQNLFYRDLHEMPLYNWIQIHDKKNTKYVLIDFENAEESQFTATQFEKLYEEFFNSFGMTSEFIESMRLQRSILMKRIDAVLTGNRTLNTLADIQEAELKAKKGEVKPIDYDEIIVIMERELKFMIDTKKMSVRQFYNHLKVQADRNKKLNEIQKEWQRKSKQRT